MEMYIAPGVIAIFLGIFAVGILLGNRREKALKQLAETMGFSFDDDFFDGDDEFLKSLGHLALFRQARTPEA